MPVQMVNVIGHIDNAMILQEANETPDLAGERRPVGFMAGKASTMAPVLLEASNDGVIDCRHRNALLLDPEQEMTSGSSVERR